MKPTTEVLRRSIAVTQENAKRLLEDAQMMFDFDRWSTAYALAVLAQEEFAKALLLQLVEDEAIPWVGAIRRSMSHHECKHLTGIVLEWLPIFEEAYGRPDEWGEYHKSWMAWHGRRMKRIEARAPEDTSDLEPSRPEVPFPAEVAKALNIFRHEQIERLRRRTPWVDEDWAEGRARKVADGSIDRRKQSALYVHIGKTGAVGLHPGEVTRDEAAAALQLGRRFSEGIWSPTVEYRRLIEVLPAVFADVGDDD